MMTIHDSYVAALNWFLIESLMIEGIHRQPTNKEMAATQRFMDLSSMSWQVIADLQAVYAPGYPMRLSPGMDVRVGDYVAPPGGPEILSKLKKIAAQANRKRDPWKVHVAFESLHPFMDGNGRTGRALWAWQMHSQGQQPFAIGFLHRWYYQTLAEVGRP